jgi:hypothetical protein
LEGKPANQYIPASTSELVKSLRRSIHPPPIQGTAWDFAALERRVVARLQDGDENSFPGIYAKTLVRTWFVSLSLTRP